MRIPSFNRTLSPTEESRTPFATLPKLRQVGSPPTATGKAISALGRTIQGIGEEMKGRQDNIRATELLSVSRERTAEFLDSLTPDDYADHPEQLKEFAETQKRDTLRRARDLKIGPDAINQLERTLTSNIATQHIETIRNSKRLEVSVTTKQLQNLEAHVLKQVDRHGLGSGFTRGAAEDLFNALEAAKDVLGSEVVEGLKVRANQRMEEQSYETRVLTDTDAVVAGGLDQFVHTINGEKILRAAMAEQRRRRGLIQERFNISKVAARSAITDTYGALNAMDTDDFRQYGIKMLQAISEDRIKLVEFAAQFQGTFLEETAAKFAIKQYARIKAAEAMYKFKLDVKDADLEDIPGLVSHFDDRVLKSFFGGYEDFGLEASKFMIAVDRFAEERGVEIRQTNKMEQIFSGGFIGTTSAEVTKTLQEQVWDQVLTREMADGFGIEGGGAITIQQAVLQNMVGLDGGIDPGVGVLIVENVIARTGQVPGWYVNRLESDLTRPVDVAGDVQRTASIARAAAIANNDPTILSQFSDDMRAAITQFNMLHSTNPEVFGASIRNSLDPVMQKAVMDRIAELDVDFIKELEDRLPNRFGEFFTAIQEVKGRSWTARFSILRRATGAFFDDRLKEDADLGDLTGLRREKFNIEAIKASWEGLGRAYIRSGRFDNVEDALDAASADFFQNISVSSFGTSVPVSVGFGLVPLGISRDESLVFMAIDNPLYQHGTPEQIAQDVAREISEIRKGFARAGDDLPGVTATDILTGKYILQPELSKMRGGRPLYRILDEDGRPFREANGDLMLYQPPIDATAREYQMRKARLLARTVIPVKHAMIDAVDRAMRWMFFRDAGDAMPDPVFAVPERQIDTERQSHRSTRGPGDRLHLPAQN